MKKKFLLLFPGFLCLVIIARAQDFEPGQQAQGYLDSKNITVDYCTGIFHYKIPLFTLGAGDFQLPVTMDYTAKGVKREDTPGLLGYGWTLNSGGVVTRTIRGGIADEDFFANVGYLWAEREEPEINVPRVNKRERDGESDIFTAVFNGQSVSFIIKMDSDKTIHAEPLEQTNVRIECESESGRKIHGWVVTDEDGNRYVYRQKEWSVDIVKEGAISFNGVRGKSYVSSWFLSRVEPRNREPIVYVYEQEVEESGNQDGINETSYRFNGESKYVYGRAMEERSFDFSPYKNGYDQEIGRAIDYLNGFSVELQLNNSLNEYQQFGMLVRNPNFEVGLENYNSSCRVMGLLADLRGVGNASNELIKILDQLERQYKGMSSYNAQQAGFCFQQAKNYVIQSIEDVKQISTRELTDFTYYVVRSPLLKKMTCANRTLLFNYQGTNAGRSLNGIEWRDLGNNKLSEIRVSQRLDLLEKVSFAGKDGEEINSLRFDYHGEPFGWNFGWDVWGYRKRVYGEPNEHYVMMANGESAKILSLKTIVLPDGGKINLDYESNFVANKYAADYDDLGLAVEYGGIRVKSMIFDDNTGSAPDTTCYRYPLPGILVYDDYSNVETVDYGGFSDNILHSRVKLSGCAFVNTGNNGVFYRYVTESMPGKGTKAYLFHVPFRHPYNTTIETTYAFWLNGLPLATAVYDDDDNLKQIVKNRYYTDFSNAHFSEVYLNDHVGYFVAGDTAWRYKFQGYQVRAFEYYMDVNFLSSYYLDQERILLYSSNGVYCYSYPYSEIYLANIAPRTGALPPVQLYTLYCGGKTLLKEQLFYRFENPETRSVSLSDFSTKTTGQPFQKTEYFYDNKGYSVLPTRVARTDSRGDVYTRVIKRVTEMEDGVQTAIASMKAANVLALVVKQANLKNDVVQDELVMQYEEREVENKSYIGLSRQHVYVPEESVAYSHGGMDNTLFTYGQPGYSLEKTYGYEQRNNSYVPVSEKSRSVQTAYLYDYRRQNMILKAKDVNYQFITAVDRRDMDDDSGQIDNILDTYNSFKGFYDAYMEIDPYAYGSVFCNYARSGGYKMMLELIRVVAMRDESIPYVEINELLEEVRANTCYYTMEFQDQYQALLETNPSLNIRMEDVCAIFYTVSIPEIYNADFLYKVFLTGEQETLFERDTLHMNTFTSSKRLKLYVLNSGYGGAINYIITRVGGVEYGGASSPERSSTFLNMYSIDLSSYHDLVSIDVCKPYSGNVYMALVPENTVFEAVSYNSDGTVYCRFNQNCQVEINEYDTAGRLIRVKDQDGNVIKENDYNVIKVQ